MAANRRWTPPIDWGHPRNLLPLHIAEGGRLHASVIAEMTGLTVGQVYYRLRQQGVSISAARRGETPESRVYIKTFRFTNLTGQQKNGLSDKYKEAENKANKYRKAKRERNR